MVLSPLMSTFDPMPLLRDAFPTYSGSPTPVHLAGDASNRVYHRLHLGGGGEWPESAVVMQIGGDPLKSNEATGGSRPLELPFLSVQRYLAALELPVPTIYAFDAANGLMLLEDLGDEMLFCALENASPDERLAQYADALDLLVEFQRRTARLAPPTVVAEQRFEPAFLDWELEHFREYGLKRPFRGAEIPVWERAKRTIVERIAQTPYIVVHRDFQSRNLMRHAGRLYLIDFQDALFGPTSYDLVALLRDSYIDLDEGSVDALLEAYLGRLEPAELPRGADAF
ncbi:MAG: phosphotransferase, partial [Myxococcales bacterium]|nr:phosphotransferase [Myxococcales bacterium]